MLALAGVPIPGEVSVALAIFVLPLNSAFNHFLYTYNVVMEMRRKKKEERMLKELAANVQCADRVREHILHIRASALEIIQ
jgi:hypothetical protein